MWYLSISGTELLKPSDFRDKCLSATPEFMLMKWIWKALKDGGWLPGEPNLMIRGLEIDLITNLDLWMASEVCVNVAGGSTVELNTYPMGSDANFS